MAVHILHLPSEVLSAILSWVPCSDLMSSVLLVCRQFRDLLLTDWYWKTRFVSLTASQPLLHSLDLKQWQRACLQYEGASMEQKICLLYGAVGGLDCVHILHPSLHGTDAVIAAGSRDSGVYLWRCRRDDGEAEGTRTMRSSTRQSLTGHKGWVWSLATEPGRGSLVLCSGAWDHNVKVWDIGVGTEIATVRKQHNAAVLSLTMPESNLLVSSSYDKHVREIDLRQPVTVKVAHKQHTKPVLTVAASDRYVYSGSEDKTVCVWDRRSQKQLQKLKLKALVPSLCLDSDVLTVACDGVVNVYDAKHGSLEQISSFSPEHQMAMTSVRHNLGTIVTASKDGTVNVHGSALGHECITKLDHHCSAITGLDLSRKTIAIASSDRTVSLCTPQY